MPVWVKTRLLEPTPFIARLLLIALGALTVWADGYAPSRELMALAAVYAAFTMLLFAIPAFEQPPWLVFVAAVLDVGATTAFATMTGAGRVPVWVLYVFPLAAAGAAGRMPALVASCLMMAGYAVSSIAGVSSEPADVWPIGLLAAMAVLIALLPSRWLVDWREKRGWEQLAAERESARRERILAQTAAQLLATFEPERVGQAVADAASDGLRSAATLTRRDAGEKPSEQADPPKAAVVPVGESYSLTVASPTGAPEPGTIEWLQRLGKLVDLALARCAQHHDLEAEERRLRALWESLPAPAALWSPSGALVLANAAFRELEVSVDIACEEPEQELTVGEPARTFVVMGVGLADGGSRLALLREVTRERQELKAKDEFLSLVGHELRTPLTSIHGFSQMIDRNLSVIKQQVGQLDRLINDLATESSGMGGKLSLDLQPVDLAELAKSAADRFTASYPDRTLELDVQDVAPVKADQSRLIQVVDNLLNNAVKYSPEAGHIRLRVEMRDANVVLGVEDQGVGIGKEHLPHLFDRFYRAPNEHTEQVKGLGLGLSIVRDLVVAHGGRVWAESGGPGSGSTFLVSLPPATEEGDGGGQ